MRASPRSLRHRQSCSLGSNSPSPSRSTLPRNSSFCEGTYIPDDLSKIPIPCLIGKADIFLPRDLDGDDWRRDAEATLDFSTRVGPSRFRTRYGAGLSTIIEQRSIATLKSRASRQSSPQGRERLRTSYGWLDELDVERLWPSLYRTRSLPSLASLHDGSTQRSSSLDGRPIQLMVDLIEGTQEVERILSPSESSMRAFLSNPPPRRASTTSLTNSSSTRPQSEATTLVGSVRENRMIRTGRPGPPARHPVSTIRSIVSNTSTTSVPRLPSGMMQMTHDGVVGSAATRQVTMTSCTADLEERASKRSEMWSAVAGAGRSVTKGWRSCFH